MKERFSLRWAVRDTITGSFARPERACPLECVRIARLRYSDGSTQSVERNTPWIKCDLSEVIEHLKIYKERITP